jgi:hypothetical protein
MADTGGRRYSDFMRAMSDCAEAGVGNPVDSSVPNSGAASTAMIRAWIPITHLSDR